MHAANPSVVRRAVRRALTGKSLDLDEAEVLLGASGDALADVCAAARSVRDQGLLALGRPRVVTYSRKVFIPLTRLCRDPCHYCTFATVPGRLPAAFLSPDEVLQIARDGAALGCKEALFTLGDRPEERWPAAREWLDAHGHADTLSYVRAMAIRVLEEPVTRVHPSAGCRWWPSGRRLAMGSTFLSKLLWDP
jgi:FO synthase